LRERDRKKEREGGREKDRKRERERGLYHKEEMGPRGGKKEAKHRRKYWFSTLAYVKVPHT
jgi:hypothetical protein